jgi:hypothetical protein
MVFLLYSVEGIGKNVSALSLLKSKSNVYTFLSRLSVSTAWTCSPRLIRTMTVGGLMSVCAYMCKKSVYPWDRQGLTEMMCVCVCVCLCVCGNMCKAYWGG